jgi:WD40 repeat protein/uncharacterized caspase-like protein
MVGRRVALLVATDRYQDTGLSRLAAPASDAKQLAAVLRDIRIAGFEVTTLYNKPHYVAGRAIGDFYRDRRGNDLTLLYFTGHGVKDEDGRLYLAMTDTDRENLPFTGLPSEQIRAAMEGSRSRQKVLVLDCCYAGAFPVGLGIKGDPSVHALEQLGGRGCVVLTSSDAMQLSFEGNQVTETGPASLRSGPSSLFTRFLIEGLRTGKADLDGDGDITLDELYSYVHDRVIDEQPLQRPKKKEDIEGRICFAQNIYWTVPSRISDAVNSPYPPGKLSALEELRSLHYRGNDIVKQRVLETVRLLAEDDSKSVSGAASRFLSELILQEERRQAEETARREAEETARREAEETARREAEETARREAEETARRDGARPAQRPLRRRGRVTAWIGRHRVPVFALACAIVAAAVTLPFISPSSPSSSHPSQSSSPPISSRPAATGIGWVSLGNLSENPSPVDMYLYPSGSSAPQFVQHDVGYGTLLSYKPVSAGDYSVKVRPAGSSASSNPVWSVGLTVNAGGTYTVAPLRASAQKGKGGLRVIDNNLTTPSGKSFVRVIQADLNQNAVTFHCSCAAGAPGNITTAAAPGTMSPQVPIPAGTWTMTATGPSAKTSLPVTLTAGTVHTEIVISKPGGGIEIINLVDGVPSYQRIPVALPSDWRSVLIASVAFSPSSTTLAVASAGICLWVIAANGCTGSFESASVNSIAFSPDGKTLAAGDRSGNTYLLNILNRTQSAPLTDSNTGSSGVLSVAFSRDGKFLAAGDSNGRTYLWDVATRKPIVTLPGPGSAEVNSVAFSPDGKTLAVGEDNGRTYLWDPATAELIATVGSSASKLVMSVAFSPDGKLLVVGDKNGRTYLWNVATPKLIGALTDPGGTGVISVACSIDNTTMAAGDNNGSIYVWNVITQKLIAKLADPNNTEINSVAFSADGTALAAGDLSGSVFLWNISLSP